MTTRQISIGELVEVVSLPERTKRPSRKTRRAAKIEESKERSKSCEGDHAMYGIVCVHGKAQFKPEGLGNSPDARPCPEEDQCTMKMGFQVDNDYYKDFSMGENGNCHDTGDIVSEVKTPAEKNAPCTLKVIVLHAILHVLFVSSRHGSLDKVEPAFAHTVTVLFRDWVSFVNEVIDLAMTRADGDGNPFLSRKGSATIKDDVVTFIFLGDDMSPIKHGSSGGEVKAATMHLDSPPSFEVGYMVSRVGLDD